jgi:hypothetical protein
LPNLLNRLTRQLASKGVKGAKGMAAALLQKRGQLSKGKLTAEGKKRQAMGADGRAKDRAAKKAGRKTSEYKYSSKTNRATLK